MYHIFFIHSSVDGHLDCFQVLANCDWRCCEHWGACMFLKYDFLWGFPGGLDVKESACNAGYSGSIPGRIYWGREWLLTLVFLPGEFHE